MLTESELFEILINFTDGEALKELYYMRTHLGKRLYDGKSNKSGALDDLAKRLGPVHCADYIRYAVDIPLEEEDNACFPTALALLRNLILVSNPVKLQAPLRNRFRLLEKKVHEYPTVEVLYLWKDIVNKTEVNENLES